MNKKLLDQIAKIISPYLKTKHKDRQSNQIAQDIMKEIEKDSKENAKDTML
jgi:hypothetical protein